MRTSEDRFREFWCVMNQTDFDPDSIICEFELSDDKHPGGCQGASPLHGPNKPRFENYAQSMQSKRRLLVGRRIGEKKGGNSLAMDTLNTLSQVEDRLATAPSVESLLEAAAETVKNLTGFHRVMVYRFDQEFNARVVTEHTDANATKDTYLGRTFAASEITKDYVESHKLNKLCMLYDRDISNARLVCSASKTFQYPLKLAYSYLRAVSDDRLKFFAHIDVRSSMSISINTFNRLWGLIVCHSYGLRGMRVSFPIRRICYFLSDMMSRNMERFSYVSQLKAKHLVNTLPTSRAPSGCHGTSLKPLLKLLHSDFGILSVRNTTQVFGSVEQPQDALVMLAYLRLKTVTSVLTSTNIELDFPDLRCPFDLRFLGGVLVVPLSHEPKDFVIFFRKRQFQTTGKTIDSDGELISDRVKEHSELETNSGALFETPTHCRDWAEEEVEIALVFAFVYSKLIAIWGHDEAALQSSRLTQLLLANSAHEIRTPLNAVVNYLELALEGSLDEKIRTKLEKSQLASKCLLHFAQELVKLITGNKHSR
ncbi:Cyanobacterial phytochrome B [Stagonosporopsis vannaccii]|nr:Cyanobacterial phytochrome B [Stagonosporopsis vannaccii]